MYALVNYKGEQIKIQEGEKVKVPFQKDLKVGSKVEFQQVLFLDDGKTKKPWPRWSWLCKYKI